MKPSHQLQTANLVYRWIVRCLLWCMHRCAMDPYLCPCAVSRWGHQGPCSVTFHLISLRKCLSVKLELGWHQASPVITPFLPGSPPQCWSYRHTCSLPAFHGSDQHLDSCYHACSATIYWSRSSASTFKSQTFEHDLRAYQCDTNAEEW